MEEIFLKEDNFNRLRGKVKENSGKKIIIFSNNDEFSRQVLEKLDISVLVVSVKDRKDFSKQRNSGLNHVLCEIAKKRGIVIGIDFDEIVKSSGKVRAEILGRVMQNIRLCNKKKVFMRFVSVSGIKRDKYDLKSLGLVLGMPTWMTKGLVNFKN
jgi:RNase P/RNase MRP subunit p30